MSNSMPEGRVELFPLTPLDRTGVSCWNAIFLNADGTRWHGVAPHGVGYGVDDDAAIIGTTGELAEAVHSALGIWRLTRRTASYDALRAELGERAVADPVSLVLPAGSAVDGGTALEWVPAQRWPSGETVWIPIDIAACSVGDLRPGYDPFTTPITNGLGAGPTLEFAIGHGLCELLQRDGNGTGFRAMDRGIALAFGPDEPRDPGTRALLQKMDALGIEVIPKFATDEFGTANVYCVGAERDGFAVRYPIMVTGAGEAASLDREHALRKALFEFAAARVRKAFSHAPLADIEPVAPPGYVRRFRDYHSLGGEESRSLRAMVDWLRLDQAEMKSLLADTVLSRRTTKPFSELPTWDGPLAGAGLVEELRAPVRRAGDGDPVPRPLAAGERGRARGQGVRAGAGGGDDELPPHRRAGRAQAAGARLDPGRDRRAAAGRGADPADVGGRGPAGRAGLARCRGGGSHRRPALSALSRARGA